DGTLLLFVHGGGFVVGSSRSSLRDIVQVADATGRRVISIDYTLAPRGQFQLVTDQVTAVYKAVLAEGMKPNRIGMFGGSAGGNIVAAAALKIRDQGLKLPAGLILLSPATDLTGAGDTRVTLGNADPALRPSQIQPGIDAYAPPAEQKNPYASPVFADFRKGYPPTLIQGGTKELLVSDMVRLHRALRQAGRDCDLELYEGMPHGFPALMMNAPEGKEAMAEQVAFWNKHLAKKKS
ncbi:MAG: Alpha/beta hydrolase fold-3 domain protein, partial [Rhodospirillales bacterium]|nr:Alpha/beta hydrolase fold-3 domain protein [Rhodospirillales bacterium]